MGLIGKLRKSKKEFDRKKSAIKVRFEKNEGKRIVNDYVHFYEDCKVDPNTILYESYWGRGMVDNPFAIFQFLLENDKYSNLKHVWVIDDFDVNQYSIKKYGAYKNVSFVKFNSKEYFKYLAVAKYLVNNVTFHTAFIKKKEQVYINTWHGTPLKSMGYEMVNGNITTSNTIRNFFHADYLIAANDIMKDMYLRSYKLKNIMPGKIIVEGYPRNDLMFHTDKEEVFRQFENYGLKIDRNKKIIMYAPTWKQSSSQQVVVDAHELIDFKKELDNLIDNDQYQLLIKPHQFVYNAIKDKKEYQGLLIPSTIDTNEILSVVDILISDFSSIFFDYMALERPILFYITNLEEYAEKRGLSMDIKDLPGPIGKQITEIADFINDIDNIKKEYKGKYDRMKEMICPFDDGNVTSRVVDCFINNNQSYNVFSEKPEKKMMLLSGGKLTNNGISNSMISLLKHIDYDEWDVTLFISHDANNELMTRRLNYDINRNVRVFVRCGYVENTREEELLRLFIEGRGLYRKIWKVLYPEKSMEREYKRLFGEAHFDYVVDFNGYGMMTAKMLTKSNAKRKVIWEHNDLLADMNKVVNDKQPNRKNITFVVSLYPEYDGIVACGKSVMEVNRKNLSTKNTYDKFTYAKNTIDTERFDNLIGEKYLTIDNKEYILRESYEYAGELSKATLVSVPDPKYTNFITMGRMSTEKNHENLIKGFSEYNKKFPSSRLYIIGDGPLLEMLKELIMDLDMEDKVFLVGKMHNPFILMNKCDCFILPSIHEGQPLVILEARLCGLPIILADFSSVSDSLIPDSQLVIHSDAKSICEGLCAFSEGKVPVKEFNPEEYNNEAYSEFRKAVIGQE